MQFGFVPGKGTTNAIFIARQLQKNFLPPRDPCTLLLLTWKKTEKAFDRISRKVLRQALRSVGVEDIIFLVFRVSCLLKNKNKVRLE